jgi:hypothetical protein
MNKVLSIPATFNDAKALTNSQRVSLYRNMLINPPTGLPQKNWGLMLEDFDGAQVASAVLIKSAPKTLYTKL